MIEKKLGDGEPSPPRSKYYCACCKNLCEKPGIWCNYCFTQIAMNSKHKCDQGAAQEVSPPLDSPEELNRLCNEFAKANERAVKAEGDTRELKAALREARGMLKILTRRLRPESVQEFLDRTERLLGEPTKEPK